MLCLMLASPRVLEKLMKKIADHLKHRDTFGTLSGMICGESTSQRLLYPMKNATSRVSYPEVESGRQQQRGDEGERRDHAGRRPLEEPPLKRRQRSEQGHLSA